MDRWLEYLYRDHSESELRDWASRLKMFRFFRAYGGHANDGDRLELALKYDDVDNLLSLLKSLGVSPVVYDEKPEQPVPGVKYSSDEFSAFPSLIKDTEWVGQPGVQTVFGAEQFIWCESGLVVVSISTGSYEVTTKDVEVAEKLEASWGDFQRIIVDPPRDTRHYICPKYFPDFFRA